MHWESLIGTGSRHVNIISVIISFLFERAELGIDKHVNTLLELYDFCRIPSLARPTISYFGALIYL